MIDRTHTLPVTKQAQALRVSRGISVKPMGDGAIDKQSLAAGMTVTAEIDVGARSPFKYLADPVSGLLSEAGRE